MKFYWDNKSDAEMA